MWGNSNYDVGGRRVWCRELKSWLIGARSSQAAEADDSLATAASRAAASLKAWWATVTPIVVVIHCIACIHP